MEAPLGPLPCVQSDRNHPHESEMADLCNPPTWHESVPLDGCSRYRTNPWWVRVVRQSAYPQGPLEHKTAALRTPPCWPIRDEHSRRGRSDMFRGQDGNRKSCPCRESRCSRNGILLHLQTRKQTPVAPAVAHSSIRRTFPHDPAQKTRLINRRQ